MHLWAKKRELKRVIESAVKAKQQTGRKILIINVDGELRAITKSDFKLMWNKYSYLKKHTVQQWEDSSDEYYQAYEDLKPENKFVKF